MMVPKRLGHESLLDCDFLNVILYLIINKTLLTAFIKNNRGITDVLRVKV